MISFNIITNVFVPCSIEDDDNPSFLIALGDIDYRYSLRGKSKENYTLVEENYTTYRYFYIFQGEFSLPYITFLKPSILDSYIRYQGLP